MIELENKKLAEYLKTKNDLVESGREITRQIEKVESKIKTCEDKEKAITMKVEPKELGEKADALRKKIETDIKEWEKLSEKIVKEKLKAIPKEIEKEHKDLMTEREKLERERNKVALRVQKIKDRIIPMVQKEVKPKLAEYEDLETIDVVGGKIVVKTFNHLEDWKKTWEKRNQKNQAT